MNLFLLGILTMPLGEAPLKSGLDIDQRPGPYSSLVVVGPERGTQHCFICSRRRMIP